MERILSLLLLVALTLFNEAAPIPLHIPSVFHNDLDEEEAEKTFCLEKESIEERSEENTRNRVSHISGESGDAEVSQCFYRTPASLCPCIISTMLFFNPLPTMPFYWQTTWSVRPCTFFSTRSSRFFFSQQDKEDCDRMQCPAFRAQEHSCVALT